MDAPQPRATAAAPAAALRPLRTVRDLPGPRGVPLLGNGLQIRRAHVHLDVERWARQHGPLFRFRLGPRTIVVLTDHEHIAAVLRDRPDGFRRHEQLQRIGMEMGLTPGLFGSEGDAWRRQRRMVMSGLDPSRVRAYFPQLQRVTDRLRARWQRAAREGRTLDLQPELMRYTVDTVAGLTFGADIDTLASDGDVIQQHLDKIFPALYRRVMSPLPIWRWFKSAADRQLDRSVAEVDTAIAGFIAQARERLQAEPARRVQPPNLLEAMLVAADDGATGIDDRQVAGNVLTMLLAGEDTTANTLAWLLHLLHRHPAAMARARDEVRRVVGEPGDGTREPFAPERLTPEVVGALDYLEACIHETMRLKPVAPFVVVEALRQVTIADVRIEPRTLVWCVMRHDSVSAEHFERPEAFDPQRWLAGSDASHAKRVSMPFGAGPRTCPGRYLALVEMKMALAMLLGSFEIESVTAPGGRDADVEERMSFTMVPVGLRMRVRERG
jgi:cytochrome P450